MRGTVVLTDHPWPDVEVERPMIETAGYRLIAGPVTAGSAEDVEALVRQHDPLAIMTCWAQVSAQAIAVPSNLRIVARMGVGLDNIHIPSATARGAWVTNVPDYCVEEVSDHVVALLLSAWRGIALLDRQARLGLWQPESAPPLRRVRERCVGIIGYGHIGKRTAYKLAQGFGCRVLVNSPSLMTAHAESTELQPNVFSVSLASLQREADAIVLHLPLLPGTHHLIDREFLRGCARRPWLINVSRGGLVDNVALQQALDAQWLAGAALDVIEGEPAPPVALLQRPDVIITPHIAFSSDASLLELRQRVCAEVLRVLDNQSPLHPCNSV
ncbi:MAG: C-terminal binding protein [Steroidobacteraceae bacterium]